MAALEQQQLLLQQLVGQVQALYDSPPGSAPQRQADKWLTELVGLDGAWPVLLRVVSPMPGEGQTSAFDVRLTFIAAKIMQLKIQRDWRTCPLETRQTVQAILVSHLQQQALGGAAAPHDAPIVQNQLVLAFVHVLLQTLVERHNTYQGQQQQGQSTFVMELCRLFGITGAPDLGTQLKPLLMLLSILKGLPEEHNRRGGGGGMDGLGSPSMQTRGGWPRGGGENGWSAGPLRIPEDDAHTVVNLVGSVLERCDAAEANGLAQGDEEAVTIARKAKLAALQCLQAWAMYVMLAPAWVTLGDMAGWGLLPALEGLVALAGTARALEPEAFCTVLAIITDGLRSLSEEQEHAEEEEEEQGDGGGHYGPAAAATSSGGGGGSWQAAGGGEERRRRRDEVLRSVARVLLGIGRYIVQPGNAYAGDEDVLRSACEGLLTFLERHLQPLWRRLSGGSSSQGVAGPTGSAVEEVVPMVRDLLRLLLAFTAHPDDLGSVALPTLEHWVYLPEMLELSDDHHGHEPAHDLASAAARALLEEVRPALVEVMARQCKGSPSWTAQEWRLGLGGGGGGRHQLLLHQQGGEEEEEAWSRFADVLSFRSEAMDVGEALASTWPERHRVGELLYGVMAQQSGDPLAVEAVLWLLSGVARGLRKGAEEELEEEEGGGGYYGPAGENGGGGGGYYGPASSSRSLPPCCHEGLLQPQLWTAVIQGLASLQDPHPCFFLWHTACLLLHDLAAIFLARAPPPILEVAAAFLLRALPHPVTCLVAAAALKQTCLQCCDPRSGRLGQGRERAASERLSGMLTQALQTVHASLKNGAGEGGGRLLLQHARAYADLTEALLLVVLSGSPEPSVEALAQIVTATIAAPSPSNGSGSGSSGGFPRRADRALVLCAALLGLRRGSQGVQGGNNLLDAVVERAWPAIDASLFGSLDAEAALAARQRQERQEQQQQQQQHAALHQQRQRSRPSHHGPSQQQPDELSAAVGACCDALSTLLASVRAKGRFLPLLLGKSLAFLECNVQALAAFQRESAPVSGADLRRVAEEAGVVLWPGPVVFLNRVLLALWAEEEEGEEGEGHCGPMAGGGASGGNGNGGGVSNMAQGAGAWWGLFQQGVDAAVALARAALELRVSEEDTAGGDPARRQLLVRFYEESFALLRTVADLRTADNNDGKALPPPSAEGGDPYAARRGLELAVLALEIPLENSGSLRAVLSLLDALLRQQGESALLPLLQGLPPRLLPALLRTLVATVHLPSNVRRQIADLLHLLLCNGGQGGNGPLPQASALFQQALAALLAGGDGSAALHACFAHDPATLAFIGQGLERLANPAVSTKMRLEAVREFVRCFAGLGRGNLTLEEAQEGMASVGAGGALRRGY